MFLDQKLEQTFQDWYNELKSKIATSSVQDALNFSEQMEQELTKRIKQDLVERIPDPKNVSINSWTNIVRQIDFSFQLFCKRHPQVKSDWFREFILAPLDDQSKNMMKKLFRWE